MRKTLLTSAAVAMVLATTPAWADGPGLTLRLDPGVSIPLSQPQTDHFYPGPSLTVKPSLQLTPWFQAHVALSAMALPSKLNGVGTSLGAGLGARVMRPLQPYTTGAAVFGAASPWIDGDLQMIGTGNLARPMASIGVGLALPTGLGGVWAGPFVRYSQVVDSLDHTASFDNRDAHILTVGIEFEFGSVPAKPAVAPPPTPVLVPEPPPPVVEERRVEALPLPPPPTIEVIHVQLAVQFPYDSAVPSAESQMALNNVVSTLSDPTAKVTPDKIEIDGHASSEGHAAYNEKLATKRAQAVADVLTKAGIPADRVVVKGFGSRVPIADNKTTVGRVKNRRVEFTCDITITKGGAQ